MTEFHLIAGSFGFIVFLAVLSYVFKLKADKAILEHEKATAQNHLENLEQARKVAAEINKGIQEVNNKVDNSENKADSRPRGAFGDKRLR